MSELFIGTGVALVTPFHPDKTVDFQGLLQLLSHVSDGGVDYLVVLGTTGESATLNDTEKTEILTFIKKNNTKNLPIVYGIGGNDTNEVLEKIAHTDFSGVSAILSVSPYYNKPSQRGIIAHYQAIADVSPVPVILYNVPGRTASNITAETTLILAKHPNIIGTKEASGDLIQCMAIAKNKPKDFLLISGDDMFTLPMISFGASGVISVLANAFPHTFSQIAEYALHNNFEKAAEYLFKLLKINPLMYEESNPVGVKEALHLQGICTNEVRLPLIKASESLTSRIKDIMEEEDLANYELHAKSVIS
jgi:4-hydroxy-tetrahydrodipicolinate synthase